MIDVEQNIIMCLLKGKKDYVVKLDSSDFQNSVCKIFFKAIKYLYDKKKAVDETTVCNLADKPFKNNAVVELAKVYNCTQGSAENIEHFISLLKTKSTKLRYLKILDILKVELNKSHFSNPTEIKNSILNKIDIDVYSRIKEETLFSLMNDTMQLIEDEINNPNLAMNTGLYDLDKTMGGFNDSEVYIIAGRPAEGKTSLAVDLLLKLAEKGKKCALFSLEMAKKQMTKRIMGNFGGIDSEKIRYPKNLVDEDFEKLSHAISETSDMQFAMFDKITTVEEIRSTCRELKAKDKLDIACIDYIQLCKTLAKKNNREQEVASISREFKLMSLELEIPVIVLSQLNRNAQGKRPTLAELRESGALEQDADVVIFIYASEEQKALNKTTIIVAKNRNGATGYTELIFEKPKFRFKSLAKILET